MIYDQFSQDYDRMVNWVRRLSVEMPFIEQSLADIQARRVLDVACGTGQHAIALARHGYALTGADVSVGMIEQARRNAAQAQVEAHFVVAGFGELAANLKSNPPFDALLCLGSSLPHIATPQALLPTLADSAAVLAPGGLLLLQNRNFDMVLSTGERWQPPQVRRDEDTEWLFLRFYDFNPDGSLTFNLVTLHRPTGSDWQQRVEFTVLWPLRQADLVAAIQAAGFAHIQCYGNMQGAAFDPGSSQNLVITAQKL